MNTDKKRIRGDEPEYLTNDLLSSAFTLASSASAGVCGE
jgi:hypothetical protein